VPVRTKRNTRTRKTAKTPRSICGMRCIQIQIQLQNVHTRFTEDAELAAIGVFSDKFPQARLCDMAFAGDSRNLERRGGRRNIRIEPRARGGDEVDRNRCRWVLGVKLLHVAGYPLNECLVGWSEV